MAKISLFVAKITFVVAEMTFKVTDGLLSDQDHSCSKNKINKSDRDHFCSGYDNF